MAARTSTKATESVPPTSCHASHPPWAEMIMECITTTPDGTRHGVSRPAIKKFVDATYHLPMNAAATSQLNRAIAHGTASGDFTLPKGPSGKVKLAPKKEPPSKRPAVTKAKRTPQEPSVSTSKTEVPLSAEELRPKAIPAARKYTSMAKRARVTPASGRKVPERKAAGKRGGVKKALTGLGATTRAATRRATRSRKRTSK